jgi:hypothetical protein
VPAVCGRDVTMGRRPKPARTSHLPLVTRHSSRLKIDPVVTSKCASGRPLLTGTAPQTDFRATHSKQTTKKFLTGARTHIRIFSFSPFTTQNPVQLIQHSRYLTKLKRSNDRTSHHISNRNQPANRSHRKQTIKAHLTETRISHPRSRNRISTRLALHDFGKGFAIQKRISNRFWVKNRSRRKQTIKPCLTGSRFACLAQRPSRCSVLWARRGRDTMVVQTITRLAPGGSPL